MAAEQVQDDAKAQVNTASDRRQIGDVPGVDLIRPDRFQLRLYVVLGGTLMAPLQRLLLAAEQAIHGQDHSQYPAFAFQGGVGLPRRGILEALGMHHSQNPPSLGFR